MITWVVIPVKPPAGAKTRLAGALDAVQREDLVRAMLAHVAGQVRNSSRVNRVLILGPSRLGLADDVPLLPDPGTGLNPALQSVLPQVEADRLIVLHADLPGLTTAEIDRLADTPQGTIAIGPDRHGTGTNALSLPLPRAKDFTFAFGPDSYARHVAEAGRLGIAIETIRSAGLERDVDEPEDLADAAFLPGKAE
ncbi:MAG: 2-phospho-L-lactate guanylyltransferase [Novosphingobium sp.]